jgi:hypothetical protein
MYNPGILGIVGPFPQRSITWWGLGLLVTYAIAAGVCLVTGELAAIYSWFFFVGTPSLLLATCAEAILAVVAARFFSPRQPMRHCWCSIAAAATCRFVSYVLVHFVPGLSPATREWGFVLGGPVALLCLAFGLSKVVALLRRHHWAAELARHDWFIVTLTVLMLLRHFFEIYQDLLQHGLRSYPTAFLWLTEPLLLLVVMQSLAVRRSAVRMGSGLIVRCWSALAAANFLIALGDLQAWAHRTFTLPEALLAFSDPLWVAAGIVGALAPAFQIAASSLALTWTPRKQVAP